MLKLYNTLSRKKEVFKPLVDKKVGLYTCGPTVYDYAHIGNLRTYLFEDLLKRVLLYDGYNVNHVMNFTDVGHLVSDADEGEDKMTKALRREGKPFTLEAMREVGDFYADRFKEDINKLNIMPPNTYCSASRHIQEQIDLIKKLEEKGYVYTTSDGVYFDISKLEDYGKLAGLLKDEDSSPMEEKFARIGINPEKRHLRDFALWKFNKDLGWESPWGKGFPGWHIECSAMSMKYLGESFDIHCGAEDHIRVHHTNEIAQSEAATGKPFAKYWLHGAFLKFGDAKMSKSAGSFIVLKDVIDHGFSPLEFRLLLLQTHYHKPMKFVWESLTQAKAGLARLHELVEKLNEIQKDGEVSSGLKDMLTKAKKEFKSAINDDLNSPEALAVLFNLVTNINKIIDQNGLSKKDADHVLRLIDNFDEVLGIDITKTEKEKMPEEVLPLSILREKAREDKDWQKADELRDEINTLGYSVEDTPSGQKIKKI
ncbi:MAG: cysteine--tRNA ligase [Parcubacteria group bacterium CG10_big_fil_rev_8_21_14_0_10_38_31]|nr:MAG: cysteine--tRNA ligase [Parcubacteria group bacterium CG10_big_fil_rev_8_21_14_0_10_38_31]